MKEIKTVNIIGLGALGMLYGKHISDALGYENVRFVMDRSRYERHKDSEYIYNGEPVKFNIVPSDETTPADFVIVAVKYPSLTEALDTISGSIGPHTIIMSVMNGISSEKIIADHFGSEKMIYTVAQGMDSGKFGNELKFTKIGELHIGLNEDGSKENLDAVAALLAKSNLNYVIEENILYRIWSKFMLNVGINQTCMVFGTTYGGALEVDEYFRCFIGAMREVIAVANAEGIPLSEKDLNQYVDIIRTLDKDLCPSMAQDRINKKPCEVDSFSGTLIELAKKHDIYVPVNRFLNAKAKEIEQTY